MFDDRGCAAGLSSRGFRRLLRVQRKTNGRLTCQSLFLKATRMGTLLVSFNYRATNVCQLCEQQ